MRGRRAALPGLLLSGLLLAPAPQAAGQEAAPAPRVAGEVVLEAGALARLGGQWLATGLTLPEADPSLPLVRAGARDPAAVLLRRAAEAGRAAGFAGVLYDNRDRGHSRLPATEFPALAHLAYGPGLREAGADYGIAGDILLPAIVLGNSSTAITSGPAPRSLGRLAMTAPGWPARKARAYRANHLHVYPGHRDHNAGDRFPANWPYALLSQGSSRSDQPFLRALALTLAAFPPETRERIARAGLVAPTLQMILRRNLVTVRSREAYHSAAAHPTVFEAGALAPERMVAMAAAMAPDALPPLVQIAVEEESFAPAAGLAGLSERLFDTPQAIARIWRAPAYTQVLTVSAAASRDPAGRPLAFTWAVLRGDPARVRITPLDDAGSRARIEIDWQAPREIGPWSRLPERQGGGLRVSTRVDIGVFAFNGIHDSAPAFVSVEMPAHERRSYVPGPDGVVRLVAIDYAGAAPGLAPDPLLHVSAPWRDIYIWGEDGTLAASRREGAEGAFFSSGPLRRCREGESPKAGSAGPDCLSVAPDPAALFTK